MKRILLCILILTACAGSASAEAMNWHLARTKHFVIYYSGRDLDTAERAGKIAETWRATLVKRLKFEPKGYIPIYLYPERRSFSKEVGVEPSDPTVGMAHTQLLGIRVDASGAFGDISRIIPHELVHVYISEKLGESIYRLPIWMNEGLAKFLAEDWSPDDSALLADAASGSELIPFSQLVNSFPSDRRQRSIAYVESYSAVSFMAKKYSDQSLLDLLDELSKGELFPTALKNSIGEAPDEFQAEWDQQIREEYNPARWTRFGAAMIWVLMAVSAILAYHARKFQKRRKVAEYDKEESERN